jgi:nucleoside 2-deoxyribosyltransferase
MPLKLYLAGPDVFLADAREVGRRKQEMCRSFGFEGLFPLDNEDKFAADALSIFRQNCALMQRADIAVFNLTPFRGPSADSGTVFELGFMFSKDKPVYGYTSDPRTYCERVAATSKVIETETGPRDGDKFAVENFGWRDNLMIVAAIEEAGGAVTAVAEPGIATKSQSLAALAAFEACLGTIRERSDAR